MLGSPTKIDWKCKQASSVLIIKVILSAYTVLVAIVNDIAMKC